ncbi:MAG TPA: glycosyltransferase family 39 protein [Vicinamibacteria bacterium]|nr:glycosyltransferase family 39 protein [Vicinamibacteria bacterium]
MTERPARRWPGGPVLLALTAALLLFRLGTVPLLGPDEPRYARVAVEMRRSGDLVTPTLQGQPWLEKPILYYWLAAAAFAALGENETAARLPSVVAGVLFVGATAFIGWRLYGATAGLHAGFVLATAFLPFAYGRAAAMDMLLAATVTAGIGLMALVLLGLARPRALLGAAAFFALATLAKGPLGVVLPALVAGGYLVSTHDREAARRLLSPAAAAVFVAGALPWYALILRAQGRTFVDVFLLDHNLARFTSEIHRHPGPPYYYVPVLLVGLFPWSGFVLPALGAVRPRLHRVDVFVLLWLAVPFAFFSAAGAKLPGYILPCFAPAALLIGRAAEAIVKRQPFPPGTGARAAALLNFAVAAAAAVFLWSEGQAALPLAAWVLLTTWLSSRRLERDPAGALAILRVGGAGFLLLLALSAPPLLARRESGRDLFLPAARRPVLAWGAWRTAWMAGLFYNDGQVREVAALPEVLEVTRGGPALVLCGPAECRVLTKTPSLRTQLLAEGPRSNALMRVERVTD